MKVTPTKASDRETATEELVERAIEMATLSDGDTVSITVDSSDSDWQAREEEQVRRQLEERYGERIVIQLGSAAQQTERLPPSRPRVPPSRPRGSQTPPRPGRWSSRSRPPDGRLVGGRRRQRRQRL